MSLELKSKGETTLPDIHGKATGVTINAQQLQICKQARGNESWRLFVNHYRLALFLDPKIEESFLKSTKCVDVRKLANMPLSPHPAKEADIRSRHMALACTKEYHRRGCYCLCTRWDFASCTSA
jgi:hypothetical protein